MRLLLLNPNTTPAITAQVAASARACALPDTEIVEATGEFGAAVIGTRTENAIAAHAALQAALTQPQPYDALVLAVSLDTGLDALREALDVPVVGLTEAALITATMVSRHAALLTLGQRMLPMYGELIAHHGFSSRVPVVEALTLAPQDFLDRPLDSREVLREHCKRLANQGMEAIVLAGAVFAGHAAAIQSTVPVPLIDGAPAAVALAEMLVRLRLPKAELGSLAAPHDRASNALAPQLAAWLRREK
jgi:allantoin racemase